MQAAAQVPEPPLSDDITASNLDAEVRRDLRGLQRDTAEKVARHLVAAGRLVDEDPERALEHARFARARASRIAVVREAAGIAAYHAGQWAEALSELRAARRMGGGPGHLALMADIERALGRPERALELSRGPEVRDLDKAERIELAIVAAGARRDLGELDAAVVSLQIPELDPKRREPWSARLFYAYADNLLTAGRESEALQWFVHAADADDNGETDAAERIAELTGEPLPDDEYEFGVEVEPDEAGSADDRADEPPLATEEAQAGADAAGRPADADAADAAAEGAAAGRVAAATADRADGGPAAAAEDAATGGSAERAGADVAVAAEAGADSAADGGAGRALQAGDASADPAGGRPDTAGEDTPAADAAERAGADLAVDAESEAVGPESGTDVGAGDAVADRADDGADDGADDDADDRADGGPDTATEDAAAGDQAQQAGADAAANAEAADDRAESPGHGGAGGAAGDGAEDGTDAADSDPADAAADAVAAAAEGVAGTGTAGTAAGGPEGTAQPSGGASG